MTVIDDARAMVTGFGSVFVQAGSVSTRGLFDDAETPVQVGDAMALYQTRALLVVAVDVPDLRREDTIDVGAIANDDDRTSYRVVDLRLQGDGVVMQVLVAT